MSHALSLQLRVQGDSHSDITDAAVAAWQDYIGDPEAELPWSTEFTIYPMPVNDVARAELGLDEESKYYAEVTVNLSTSKD
jgi:hypothetical protein